MLSGYYSWNHLYSNDFIKRERLEQLRVEAEELRRKRQIEIEEAKAWTEAAKLYDIDEDEKKQKGRRKKKGEKADVVSDDEVDGEKKKRQKGRLKKQAADSANGTPAEDGGEEPLFSDAEGGDDKPKKACSSLSVIHTLLSVYVSVPVRSELYATTTTTKPFWLHLRRNNSKYFTSFLLCC